MQVKHLIDKLKSSKFAKDSLWAVLGNGFGNGLLLIAGIVIARFLGKDLYGEYGVVKTNMLYMAGFATFGMVFTSTRFVSRYLKENIKEVREIIKACVSISLLFSLIISIGIIIFSHWLELLLEVEGIGIVLKSLAFIIVLKAMATTGNGILGGLGKYDTVAKSNVLAGIVMLFMAIPFTYFWSLPGALVSLAFSQMVNCCYNFIAIYKVYKKLPSNRQSSRYIKRMITFSFPIALQEISYGICNWCGIILLTRLSSIGQVGIYSATAQWNAVIMMIPGLLSNVILSHLSAKNNSEQKRMISSILKVYIVCTLVPFIVIYLLSGFITSFYGADFKSMKSVLQLIVFATIPMCCSDVFKSELIALGRTWTLFTLRLIRDLTLVLSAWGFLVLFRGENGAFFYALSTVIGSVVFLLGSWIAYIVQMKKQ